MFNEVHSIHGHTLLLITKPSLQATALLQHLKQSLAIAGKLHNIQRSLDDISSGCIILLDMMEADKKLIHYWQDTLSRKNNNIKTLLLNTPGNDSNLLIVFYVQIMPDDFVMQLHRF